MRILLLAALFLTSVADATTLQNVPYDRLVSRSDVVMVGMVVAARFGGVDKTSCDAIYDVNVVRSVKGVKSGEIVTVGPYAGLELGGKYLYFLDKTKSVERFLASTNSLAEKDEHEAAQRCLTAKHPDYTVLLEGIAALKVEYDYFSAKADIVHFPPMWVVPPERVKVTPEEYQASVWGKDKLVVLEDLLK